MSVNHHDFDDRSEALKRFDAICALARQANMERDPRIMNALRLISMNSKDQETVRNITRQTLSLVKSSPIFQAQQLNNNPFLPFPGRIVSGPITLGKVFDPLNSVPIPFGLHKNELNQNLLAFGRAGSGKTVLLMTILANLMKSRIPFWIMDFKKDYRHLVRRCSSLIVFNWNNFKFNPLAPPPGTDANYWLQIVADVFFESFFSSSPMAAKSAFLEVVWNSFNQSNTSSENKDIPSFFDLDATFDRIKLDPNRFPSSYKERLKTCQSRIRPLLKIIGKMLDCQRGYSIEDLLHRNVVLELDGLSDEVQSFLVNILFYWIFTYRLNNVQRGQLRHILIFDEAKMVFSKDKASGSSSISRLVSTAREMGQGLILADQMPSTLGHAILANVYTMIGLNLSATKDIHDMSYAMGLTSEQREYVNRLPVGTGIVKMADRYTSPFLVQFPNFQIKKDVNDVELTNYMAPHLASLKFQPRTAKESQHTKHTTSQSDPKETKQTGNSDSSKNNRVPGNISTQFPFHPSDREYTYLMDVKNRPFVSITERNRSLKLTNYMGNRICRNLINHDLVREVEIKSGQRGRSRKFLELTADAQNEVGKQNLGQGKGRFEHVFHQHRLQEHFTGQGYLAKIEEFRNGKSADIGLSRNCESIAIEIAMSPYGEISNIRKDYQSGWDRIMVLCNDPKVMSQVQEEWQEIKNEFPDGYVEFYLISDPIFNSDQNICPKERRG